MSRILLPSLSILAAVTVAATVVAVFLPAMADVVAALESVNAR